MNRGKNKQIDQGLSAATTGLQRSSNDLSRFGDTLAGQASPVLASAQKSLTKAGNTYDQVGSYLSPIMSGGRGAINQALAPDLAAITETYRGAGKALEGMRGGTRDVAAAELNRDKAGKLALLPSMARANAAQGLMQVGQGQAGVGGTQAGAATSLFGQAAGSKAGAAQGYSNLFSGAQRQAETQMAYGHDSSSSIGRMIFDATKSTGKKPGKGGGVLPTSGPAIAGFPGLPGAVSPSRP